MLVLSITGAAPPPRYDGQPFVVVRIEESATPTGDWSPIDTITLDPVDADPAHPQLRDLSTEAITITDGSGWYRLVFLDAQGDSTVPTEPTPFNESSVKPSLAEVAALIHTRTIESDTGEEAGTFTAKTPVKVAQAQALIDFAASDVLSRISVKGEQVYLARTTIAYHAARLIEVTLAPEQATDADSPYARLDALYATSLAELLRLSRYPLSPVFG